MGRLDDIYKWSATPDNMDNMDNVVIDCFNTKSPRLREKHFVLLYFVHMLEVPWKGLSASLVSRPRFLSYRRVGSLWST